MAACHWPEAREHKLEHRDVVARVDDMHRRFDGNPEIAGAAVNDDPLAFLCDWLNPHSPIQDVADRRHAESNPAAREAARWFKATEVWWSRRSGYRPRETAARPTPPPAIS